MRGDQTTRASSAQGSGGTPPRAWGSGSRSERASVFHRDTPTCVGISTCGTPPARRGPGHPHVRGDQRSSGSAFVRWPGTPPRAWGSARSCRWHRSDSRDTPTCVGISHPTEDIDALIAGHPHVRGDQVLQSPAPSSSIGTPPRAWGSARCEPGRGVRRRDTPTCVGIRRNGPTQPLSMPGHPHVRGDQSSLKRHRLNVRRDTPTCVGIRKKTSSFGARSSGHPHVRGDQAGFSTITNALGGTPPRAWGSGLNNDRAARLSRDTPTCVGISGARSRASAGSTGHPHVRGDQR